MHALAAHAIETAVKRRGGKKGTGGSSLSCPHCGEAARFVEYRSKDFVSLVGGVRLSRAYYHWRAPAARGSFPWDAPPGRPQWSRLAADAGGRGGDGVGGRAERVSARRRIERCTS